MPRGKIAMGDSVCTAGHENSKFDKTGNLKFDGYGWYRIVVQVIGHWCQVFPCKLGRRLRGLIKWKHPTLTG